VTLGLSGLASSTDATGAYSMGGIPAAAYPQLLPTSPGYDRNPRKVVVAPGANTLDVSLRRDWSSSSGGARVISATGPDYSGYGCGPGEALDQESLTGWSTDATGTVQSLVVALPAAVNLEEIGVYPAGVCGDSSASAVRDFTADVSKDGSTWLPYTTASFRRGDVGRLNFLFAHYLNLGSTGKGTRYVRFNVSSNQAGVTGPGKYIDVAELEVFGVPPGAIQPPVPPPPTGPIDTTKPTPFSATVVVGAKQKLKTLLKKGLPVQFTCSSRCTGAASLKAKRKSLGAAMHELVAGGKARMTVRVSKKAAKKALRKGKKWKLALRLVVTGPQGRRSFSKTVTVRR
jgi:hypothetical protein